MGCTGKVNALHVRQQYLYSSVLRVKQSVLRGGGGIIGFLLLSVVTMLFFFFFFHSNFVCQSVLKQSFVLF